MGAGGIVLCGGRSSRMGRPKAWLPFGQETLLQRTVRVSGEVLAPVVVVAAPGQELPDLPPAVRVVRDDREFLGPLNGLAAGLAALAGNVEVAYLSSCDTPFLRPAFIQRVVERLGAASICVPDAGGFLHPLAAAYRVSLLPNVRYQVWAGRLRMSELLEKAPVHVLGPADFTDVDPDLQSLRNLNTLDEYRQALADAGQDLSSPG